MMTVGKIVALLFSLILFARGLTAQSFPADFERYLVPVYIAGELEGAFGSRWVTEISLLNTSGEPVLIYGYDQGCRIDPCPPMATPPGITLHPVLNFWAEPEILGIYLFVEKGKTAAFNLRVRDLSRDDRNFGTQIPVIPESRARAGTLNVLDVPIDQRFRQALRVYDFAPSEGTQTHIRIYKDQGLPLPTSDSPDVLLVETTVPFSFAHSGLGTDGHPGLAELLDFGSMPQLSGVDRVRLEINSSSPSSRLWSMVSITNNATQFVTLVTSEE